jgi:hypothetical protein
VLLVAHTNRGDRQNLRNTYGLSGALRQVARTTLYAAEDPDTNALLVGPDKSNLGNGALAERFERSSVQCFDSTPGNDGNVACLDHLGSDGRTIIEALSEGFQSKQPQGKTEAIDAWLRDSLADGPVKSTVLEQMANEQGYSGDQLRRSKGRVAKTRKVGGEWLTELKTD